MSLCNHPDDVVFYFPAVNEAGWRCSRCHRELGFRPDLDRLLIHVKVDGLIHDLHEAKLIVVSNGTEGLCIMENVAGKCKLLDRYDQLTILKLILEDGNVDVESHAEYWRKQSYKSALKETGPE